MNYYSSTEDFSVTPKNLNYLNLFFLGLIIYTASYIIKGHSFVSQKMGELSQLAGLAILLVSSVSVIKFNIKNGYLRSLFLLYLLWSLTIIGRGISFNITDLKDTMLNADYGILLYFAPLILLFPQNATYFKRIFDVIIILGCVFLACNVLFIRDLLDRSFATQNVIEYLSRTLAMPCGFLLLTYKYHSNKRNLLSLLVITLSLLFSIYKARRGLSITLLSILISAYFIYLIYTKKKILLIYLSSLVITLGVIYATNIYQIANNKLLSMIADRAEDDTRTGVELYFYDDMKTNDWIIGRGVNGKYFCPNIGENQLTNYRTLIETGYLQIILKGGLIRLILFLLIAIPAIILGLFFSKNILSKASALWIIIALISLYPATVESFSLQYLLVWISIGICYTKSIRQMPDGYIHDQLSAQHNGFFFDIIK